MGIVAGERLALAGRGIDLGLAGAFRRILHAVDMVEVGLVPLDRVGRRIADEDLAHQRMRQAAGVLALGLVVERADLACQMLSSISGATRRPARWRTARARAAGAAAPIHSGSGPGLIGGGRSSPPFTL